MIETMERKKHTHTGLESGSTGRYITGLIFALALVLAAFEWRTSHDMVKPVSGPDDEGLAEDEKMPIVIIRKDKNPEVRHKTRKISSSVRIASAPDKFEVTKQKSEEKNTFPSLVDLKVDQIGFGADSIMERNVFDPLEQAPAFPGGDGAYYEFLERHLHFPVIPKTEGISGTVIVEFVVGKDGRLRNIRIARGVNPYLDDEAMRVVKLMPDWISGKQRDVPVPAGIRIPIRFTLKR